MCLLHLSVFCTDSPNSCIFACTSMFIDFTKHSWGSGGLMGNFLLHSPIPIAGQEEYYQQKPISAPCCIMNSIILTFGAPLPPPPLIVLYTFCHRCSEYISWMISIHVCLPQHQLHYQKIQQYDVDLIQVGMKNIYVTQHGKYCNLHIIVPLYHNWRSQWWCWKYWWWLHIALEKPLLHIPFNSMMHAYACCTSTL